MSWHFLFFSIKCIPSRIQFLIYLKSHRLVLECDIVSIYDYLFDLLKSLLSVLIANACLIGFLFLLGRLFTILSSFIWYFYTVIILPFSLLVFLLCIVYLSKYWWNKDPNSAMTESDEKKSRMKKFHT
jgi:hypothetical protein